MAGLSAAPDARAQLTEIARVRWLIFLHSMRTSRGAVELLSRIVVGGAITLGGLGGAVLLGTGAWYFVSQGNPGWLALLLWPVFVFWQFFPVMASAFTETFDSSNLLRFPLNYRVYVLVRLVYGALDPATLLGGLWLIGIVIGIGIANARLFAWSALVLLAFGVLNVLLTQMIFAWVERWLAQRRTREIFAVLFFLVMISFQLIGPMLNRYGSRPNPTLRRWGTQISPVQQALPPGIAAEAIADMANGQSAKAVASLGLLGVFGVVFVPVLSVRLRAQYRGENLSEAPKAELRPTTAEAIRLGWRVPGLSGPVTAVLEKELRYLSRSGPMLLTLVTPIIMLLIFGFGQGRSAPGGFLQRSPDMGFPAGAAYSLLLLTNLVYNNFGADGGGIQFFLASPVRFRSVVLGKNLAHVAVLSLEMIIVWAGVSVLFHPPTLAITGITLAGMLFAVPVNLAVGNLLSLHSPKRIDFGTFGRQRASQLTVLISFAVQLLVFGTAAATLAVARYYGEPWLAIGVFLLLSLLSLTGYVLVLRHLDRLAFANREVLTTELCR